jgi:hypothetical protein
MVQTQIIGTDVRFSFTDPDDKGDAISSYQVIIKQRDGTFSEETTYCLASEDPVLSQLYCDVPLMVLRSDPYF